MSFTLRTVTQRASGGEIVRTREIDKREIVVGRGTECDLQLPDLAVSLRHARLVQQPNGRVLIEALGEETFEAQGGFVRRAEVDPATGGQVIFGAHALTFAQGSIPDDVAITIARLVRAGSAASVDQAVRALAPGSVGLSKRWTAWVLGIGIVLACLAWPISAFLSHQNARIHADQQWSSGPLSQSHAFLNGRCEACHQQAFVAVRDEACLTCHKAGESSPAHLKTLALVKSWGGPIDDLRTAGDHAPARRVLNGTPMPADFGGKAKLIAEQLFNHPETRCASCHREHIQPAAANGKAPDKPTLTPIHSCIECHTGLKARLHDTDLRDTPSWGRHPEFRPVVAQALNPGGASLLRIDWRPGLKDRTGLSFSHMQHLSRTNGVARMAIDLGSQRGYGAPLDCASCHKPQGSGFKPIEMTRDCSACHSLAFGRVGGELKYLPHGHPDQVAATLIGFYGSGGARPTAAGAKPWLPGPNPTTEGRMGLAPQPASAQAAGAIRAAFAPKGTCYGCHTITPPKADKPLVYGVAPVRLGQRFLTRGGYDHALAAHVKDKDGKPLCSQCHAAERSESADDLLIPGIAKCADCHGKTKTETPAAAGADCAECHSWHAPGRPQAGTVKGAVTSDGSPHRDH